MTGAARTLPLVLALTMGCSSTSQEWVKPGVSEAQRSRDKNECLLSSHQTMAGIQNPGSRLDQDAYRRCMENLGYRRVEAGQPR